MVRWPWVVVAALIAAGCSKSSSGSSSGGASTSAATSGTTTSGASSSGTSSTTSSTGGTSSSGGQQTYDDDHTQWPSGLHEVLSGLTGLVDGGSVDEDGDGNPDIVSDLSSGVRVETVNIDNGGVLTITFTDATHVNASGDLNGDGTPDFDYTQTISGTTVTEVTDEDTDFDGVVDLTRTRTFDLGAADSYTLRIHELQSFSDGGSGMVTVEDRTESRRVPVRGTVPRGPSSVTGCDELDNFPASGGASQWYPFGHDNTNVTIHYGGDPSDTCSQAQAQRIANALRKASKDALDCLKGANPELFSKLSDALGDRSLRISCMPDCTEPGGSILATTDLGGSWTDTHSVFGDQRMGLNMDAIGADDGALEDVLIHELLHWAGDDHKGGHTGGGGTDDVYGCGRYCSKCPGAPKTAGAGDAPADCARCSDPAHKSACGLQTWKVDADCTQAALCHAGLGGNADCTTCQGTLHKYCDGTAVPGEANPPDEECCPASGCPANFTGPDIVCGSPNGMSQGCPQVPPFCQ